MAYPSGWFMSVINACTRLSMRRPMPTMICASRRASTCFFMNAPAPTFTSRTSASRPDGELLRHDRRGDQRNGLHGSGGIAEGIKLPIGRRDLVGLADESQTEFCKLRAEFVDGQVRAKPGNGFEFIQRAAGVAQSAAGNHRDDHACRCSNRSRNQTGLVADAAGGVLIDLDAGYQREDPPPHRNGSSFQSTQSTSRSDMPEKNAAIRNADIW